MSQIKLTKTELRVQQVKLLQLQKYLPTLQLKKAMLQVEVSNASNEKEKISIKLGQKLKEIEGFASLFSDRQINDLLSTLHVQRVEKRYENIAGIEIPIFESVLFAEEEYFLFSTPVWYEPVIVAMKNFISLQEGIKIIEEKKTALEKELRDVSIRVNLFEKIMIPRAFANIKKIKIFLGDQQLAAVSQAKIAKKKIDLRATEKGRIKIYDH